MAGEYDFWLFDLDGTVVDIESDYPHQVVQAVGDRLGHEFSEREVEILWYGVGGARDQVLGELGVEPAEFWEAFHEVEDPHARARSTYLYDDAAALLSEIDRPTGIVTHCQSYLTDPVLDRLEIRDWFDAVVCCDDETGWKPDPRPVRRAMGALGVRRSRQRGVLVGDNPSDVGAAWNAGLDAAYVKRIDPHERGQCVLGDHRVERLDTLGG